MATLISPLTTVDHRLAVPRGCVTHVALWVTQVAVAGMFMLSGTLKLAGAPLYRSRSVLRDRRGANGFAGPTP